MVRAAVSLAVFLAALLLTGGLAAESLDGEALAAGAATTVIVEFDYDPAPGTSPLARAAAFAAYNRRIKPTLATAVAPSGGIWRRSSACGAWTPSRH